MICQNRRLITKSKRLVKHTPHPRLVCSSSCLVTIPSRVLCSFLPPHYARLSCVWVGGSTEHETSR